MFVCCHDWYGSTHAAPSHVHSRSILIRSMACPWKIGFWLLNNFMIDMPVEAPKKKVRKTNIPVTLNVYIGLIFIVLWLM